MLEWENPCWVNTAGSGPDSFISWCYHSWVSAGWAANSPQFQPSLTFVLGWKPLPRHGNASGVMPQPPLEPGQPATAVGCNSPACNLKAWQSCGRAPPRTQVGVGLYLMPSPRSSPCLSLCSLIKNPPPVPPSAESLSQALLPGNLLTYNHRAGRPWPAGQPPVCANQIFLENSYACYLYIAGGCFCIIAADLSSCNRDRVIHKA